MRLTLLIVFIGLFSFCTNSQQTIVPNAKLVGGPCEGCEAIFEYGNNNLNSIDTLPDFIDNDIRIKLTGTIFKSDGSTPAKDVILYIYHTNQEGIYPKKEGDTGWAKRHGYIRGWIKTDTSGKYTFYTLKPGIYPNGSLPAHIHPTILEPNGKYYWIDAYHFEGDSLLTDKEISPEFPRGGSSGPLTLKKDGKIYIAKRDFILGKNIPEY